MQLEQVGKREEEVELQNVLSTTMAKMQAASAINFIINKVCFAWGTINLSVNILVLKL